MANEGTPLVGSSSPARQADGRGRIGLLLLLVAAAVVVLCSAVGNQHQHQQVLWSSSPTTVEAQLEALVLDGQVYFPSDGTKFDDAATVWNRVSLLDKPPRAVVEVGSESDIVQLLQLLVATGTPFSVKSGGHNKAAYCNMPAGVILSLFRLNSVEMVEVKQTTAIIKMGPSTHGPQLLKAALPYGFAGILGICSTVAMSGFTLGGGYGFLSRKHGLAADNLLEARVVLGDGQVVVANETSHTDLLWSLRGSGGSNFGIVTEFSFALHPAQDLNLFGIVWIERTLAPQFLTTIQQMDRNKTLAREFTMIADFWTFDGASDLVTSAIEGLEEPLGFAFWWVDYGDFQPGKDYVDTVISSLVPNTGVFVEPFNWTFNGVNAEEFGAVQPNYVGVYSGFLTHAKSNPDSIALIVNQLHAWAVEFTPYANPEIELWGGAMAEVDPKSTAFPHRDVIYNVGVLIYVPIAEDVKIFEAITIKLNAEWESKMMPLLDGVYSNYQMSSLRDDQYPSLYWGINQKRLRAVKRKYDPNGVFNYPQSIPIEEL